MRKLLLIAVIVGVAWWVCLEKCRAATVSFCHTNFDTSISTNQFIVTRVTERDFNGNYQVVGLPIRFSPTNGCGSKVLLAGDYELKIYGVTWRTNLIFAVPSGTDTYDVQSLWVSGGNVFNYSPGVQQVIAGTGVTLSPTNGKGTVTITSTGGGTGVSVAAGTNGIVASTNATLVTIALQFSPMIASLNLTNWAATATNAYYPSNNPAGYIPSNAIAGLYGYVTNAVTTNSSTGVTNVVNSIIAQNSINALSDVNLGTPGNGNILTYENGWTNKAPASTTLGVVAGTNVTVVTNGGSSFTVSATAQTQTNISLAAVTNANNLTNWSGLSTNLLWAGVLTNGHVSAMLQTDLRLRSSGVFRFTNEFAGVTTNTVSFSPGAVDFGSMAMTAGAFTGVGTALSALSATALTSGTVPNARNTDHNTNWSKLGTNNFYATNMAINASWATNLASGGKFISPNFQGNSLSGGNQWRVAGNVSSLIMSDTNVPNPRLTFNGDIYAGGVFSGDGASLTSLDAGALATGSILDARLSNNIPRLNVANVYTASNYVPGAFVGNGAGLTNLPGLVQTNIAAAAVTNAGTAIYSNGATAFVLASSGNGTNTTLKATTAGDTISATNFVGNGANVTNIQATNIGTGTAWASNFHRGDRVWTNRLDGDLLVSGGQTNTLRANFIGGLNGSNNSTFGGNLTVNSNIANSALTAQRVLVSDNSSPPNITNMAAGGANTLLHGTTPPAFSAVVEANFGFTDIATANASTSAHGLAPKYPNDATKFLDGTGAYTVPASGISANGWNTNGNTGLPSGSFLGTTDTLPLTIKVGNSQIGYLDTRSNITFGGPNNVLAATASESVLLGGKVNSITNGTGGAILGGQRNILVAGNYNAMVGGDFNVISNGTSSVVIGGQQNIAMTVGSSPMNSVILGGNLNIIGGTGLGAIAMGGNHNIATNGIGYALGQWANTVHANTFVFSDSQGAVGNQFTSRAVDSFNVRAGGGINLQGVVLITSNSLALWPAAPDTRGQSAIVSSNGYPYMLMSTNGAVGSATWTGTNKLGW